MAANTSTVFRTAEGNFTVFYRLAAGVARAKAFVAQGGHGVWSGDMGNAAHQWNNGLPSRGKRRGDHTAWSSDGPAEVVKAFDWKAVNPAHFKAWILPQLRAGRYSNVLKFMNLLGRQYGPMGQDLGPNSDDHCHWSYRPSAVNSTVNPIEDYYAEAFGHEGDEEMDWEENTRGGGETKGMPNYEWANVLVRGANKAGLAASAAVTTQAKVDQLLLLAGEDAVSDAEVRASLARIETKVADIQAGDVDTLVELLGDRLTAELLDALHARLAG